MATRSRTWYRLAVPHITRTWPLLGAAATVVIFVVGCWGAAILLEGRLDDIPLPEVEPGLSLWAHRGAGEPANTPQAALEALLAGYRGVELDVRWYSGLGLRVGHERVEPEMAAALPTLAEILVSTGGRLTYWIDLKGLTGDNVEHIATALLDALPQPELASRLWIESRDLEQLARLRQRVPGVIPVGHASPRERYRPWPPYLFFLADLVRYQIPALALEHSDVSANLATGLEPLLLMAYTVNDADALAHLASRGVRVALTDTLPPQGRP